MTSEEGTSNLEERRTVVIAGASGFVGQAVIENLLQSTNSRVIALSRTPRESHDPERLEWRQCDIFSLLDCERALRGADRALYLVHSMLPSAHLVQGDFQDFDLVLADNFARAAQKNGVEQIVYLGGIVPDSNDLSWHLKSRREVERVFEYSQVPTVVLRAGLVIGPTGSSFKMMYNLVRRLPMMVCPKWTRSQSAPISVWDTVEAIRSELLASSPKSDVYDLAGPETVTYEEMMKRLASLMGKQRLFLRVPLFSPTLSRLWVWLVTGVPRALVYPLVESLRESLLPRPARRYFHDPQQLWSLDESMKRSLMEIRDPIFQKRPKPTIYRKRSQSNDNEVRSIQRMCNPHGLTAQETAFLYYYWLPRFFRPWIRVELEDSMVLFSFWRLKKPLLILAYSRERSTEDRPLFYIHGGILAKKAGRGRLEFRSVLHGEFILAAIHEFRPLLPWFLYKRTQAIIHLWTMNSFGKYLGSERVRRKKVKSHSLLQG